MNRTAIVLAAALAAAASLAAMAAAAPATVSVAAKPVAIKPATKGFVIRVSCLDAEQDCSGVLDVRTAAKIKPYSSIAAKIATVGTFPFRIPAGNAADVEGRVFGPALAEAMLHGRVRLSVTPRAVGVSSLGPTKNVLFTLKRS